MPDPSPTGDRRPIASRELRLWQFTASLLAKSGISPNAISILGMLAGFAGAFALFCTSFTTGASTRIHFLLAVAGIQLRLLANMLDGMVAIAAAKSSPIGELFNEIPDRLSDTAILVAAGYACSGLPVLGWAAAAVALFVTYVRALGKSMGVPALFQGPMSKSHRMFTLTLACVYLALAPAAWQPLIPTTPQPAGIMALALLLVIVGGAITALRRIARIRRALLERP